LTDLKDTQILKQPTSGGVLARTREYRKKSRDRRIREYFYGQAVGGMPLTPGVAVVGFDEIVLVRAPTRDDIVTEALRPVGKVCVMSRH